MAEVFVRPEDIASVKLKDKADLKVTAYDFSKYGKIRGEVAFISPGTVENDDKRTITRSRSASSRTDRTCSEEWHLQPGMTVDAEIISGSKSLLQYMLKPIHRGIDVAFSER